jgi:hypothetical protein
MSSMDNLFTIIVWVDKASGLCPWSCANREGCVISRAASTFHRRGGGGEGKLTSWGPLRQRQEGREEGLGARQTWVWRTAPAEGSAGLELPCKMTDWKVEYVLMWPHQLLRARAEWHPTAWHTALADGSSKRGVPDLGLS